MEKIAVLCKSKKEWDGVKKKLDKRGLSTWEVMNKYYSELCIYTDDKGCDKPIHAERDGYTIMLAQEYLNEGGADVSDIDQEKLCEFCRDHYDESLSWHCEGVKCEEIMPMYLEDNPHIKSKENKMKSNDINKNVAAVFGDVPGNDLLLVDKHFDSDMMERILMKKHKTDILKACKDAEAEALKAEKAKK